MKNKFVFLNLKLVTLILALCVASAALSQDSLGWQVYDTIKVDLQTGTFPSKYLPFDVPFFLYGSSNGIESIRLKIIDQAYQACKGDYYDIDYGDKKACDNCDCDCESIYEKRLKFFRMVRDIKNGKDTTVFKALKKLEKEDSVVKHIIKRLTQVVMLNYKSYSWIDTLKVNSAKFDHYREQLLKLQSTNNKKNGAAGKEIDEIREKIRRLDAQFFQLKEGVVDLDCQFDTLKQELDIFRPGKPPLVEKRTDIFKERRALAIFHLDQTAIQVKLDNDIRWRAAWLRRIDKFREKHPEVFAYDVSHQFDSEPKSLPSLYKKKSEMEGYRRLVAKKLADLNNDKTKLDNFKKKYGDGKSWEDKLNMADKMIAMDSMAFCPDCEFDRRKCNEICSWNRNDIIGTPKNFYLTVPALPPNHNYRFSFEVIRGVNDKEKGEIKSFVARSIVRSIDSVAKERIKYMGHLHYDLREDREIFLNNPKYTLLGSGVIANLIVSELQSEYKELAYTEIDLGKIRDESSKKKLIDQILTLQLYKEKVDTITDLNFRQKPYNHFLRTLPFDSLERYQMDFFKQGKMNEYYLLDTLHQIMREDRVDRIVIYNDPYERIQRDVSSGLVPYKNLQKLELRRLSEVNDFNTKTVDTYRTSLSSYNAYLSRVQKFTIDQLINGKPELRQNLFAPSSFVAASVTPRQLGANDGDLKTKLTNFSFNLRNHQNDVQRMINIYENFKENIENINTQSKTLIDSIIKNNRDIRVASLRNAGAITSAGFITRTEWYVTADIGLAYLAFSNPAVTPYFGINFNTHPLNRQARYGLIGSGSQRRYLSYRRTAHHTISKGCPFFSRLWKGSSVVVGVTTSSLAVAGVRDNLIGNGKANLNLLTGAGFRITDAGRFSVGTILTRDVNPNPAIGNTKIKANFYFSFSFDLDVKKSLGQVGQLLSPSKP